MSDGAEIECWVFYDWKSYFFTEGELLYVTWAWLIFYLFCYFIVNYDLTRKHLFLQEVSVLTQCILCSRNSLL